MITIKIKVVPGARQSKVAALLGDALKVQVAARAEKGKANAAVIDVLAAFFAVRPVMIRIIAGHTQPRKTVVIDGMTQQEYDAAISSL